MGSNEAAKNRVKANGLEIVAANDGGLNFARLTQAHHGETEGREIAKLADGMDAVLDVLDFGDREISFIHPYAACTLLNVDESALVVVDEWLKENAAYEAENRGVGANPKRKGGDDGKGQPFGPPERAHGDSQILKQQLRFDHCPASYIASLCGYLRTTCTVELLPKSLKNKLLDI